MTEDGIAEEAAAARRLLTPAAVRERCGAIFAWCEAGESAHFRLEPARLAEAASLVAETIRANYPSLAVPYHSRWRHFAAGGRDRWSELRRRLGAADRDETARIAFELAITSVLLDAGAGDEWRWREGTGEVYARSEGLALASLELFAAGALSDDGAPRADGARLAALDDRALDAAFQIGPGNPLVGVAGRLALLRRLGATVLARPDIFGAERPRVGGLYDHLKARAVGGRLPARVIVETLLEVLSPIWPGRLRLGGIELGDTWRHRAARADDATDGLVPFHKLSQWLAYSLLEPLEEAGVAVAGLDELTGLAEYRNGGLFVDTGVVVPRHGGILGEAHEAHSEIIVEWRALTVALLDRVAGDVRHRLGVAAAEFPLAKVLEGGTWAAGRRIARRLRPDGGPPIRLASDGTVF